MIDIKAIREAAEAAESRNWTHGANPATVLALCDEIEGLRADAARYRWLRDAHNTGSSRWAVVETSQGDWTLIEQAMGYPDQNLDAAIDIAMRGEK